MPARKTNKELLRKEASNDLKGSNKTNRSIDKLTISVTEDSSPGKKKRKENNSIKRFTMIHYRTNTSFLMALSFYIPILFSLSRLFQAFFIEHWTVRECNDAAGFKRILETIHVSCINTTLEYASASSNQSRQLRTILIYSVPWIWTQVSKASCRR